MRTHLYTLRNSELKRRFAQTVDGGFAIASPWTTLPEAGRVPFSDSAMRGREGERSAFDTADTGVIHSL